MVKLAKDAQAGLDSQWGWAKNCGFKISETKTVGVLIGNQKEHSLDVHLGGTPIVFSKVARFLGLTLDKKLTFEQHFKDLVNIFSRDLMVMKKLKGTDFGADKYSLILIYKSLIRQIDYGAEVYSCASPTQLKKLEVIQNKALRLAIGALPSTPGYLLELEAGITPLNLRRQQQILKYRSRVKSRPNNPVNKLLNTGFFASRKFKNPTLPFGAVSELLVEGSGIDKMEVASHHPCTAPPWTLSNPTVDINLQNLVKKTDLPQLVKSETQIYYSKKYQGHTHIYTDWSKDPSTGKVASAVVILGLNISITERLPDKMSINTAEMIGIDRTMSWIKENKPGKTVIFSDSLSCLISIQSNYSRSRPDILSNIKLKYNECLNLD